ncbi:MAG: flagellar export chaperone FliS, partial [Desulfatirhabdiaceae bacterium]
TIDNKEMILMKLLDGAIHFIGFARNGLEMGNIRIKAESITRVIDILTELDCALDREIGGELAQNLSALYKYMMYQLTLANLRNNGEMLDEVIHLLSQIREGFAGAIDKKPQPVVPQSMQAGGLQRGFSVAV